MKPLVFLFFLVLVSAHSFSQSFETSIVTIQMRELSSRRNLQSSLIVVKNDQSVKSMEIESIPEGKKHREAITNNLIILHKEIDFWKSKGYKISAISSNNGSEVNTIVVMEN